MAAQSGFGEYAVRHLLRAVAEGGGDMAMVYPPEFTRAVSESAGFTLTHTVSGFPAT